LITSVRRWFESTSALFWTSVAAVVSSLLLGGGTSPGFLSDAVLQLLAVPLLLIALWRLLDVESAWRMLPLAFCCALISIPLLQLIPLPPRIWTALPNRAPIVESFTLVGRELPWMPVSVSPRATWLSLLSLVPPLSVFLNTLLLRHRERRIVGVVVLSVGLLSVFIGLTQIAQGPDSPLRFFEITNTSEAVGFFANRNHFAALLCAMTAFAAAWAVEAAISFEAGRRIKSDTGWIVAIAASFTVLVALVAGQAMARSRAGIALAIVALFGALALGLSDRRSTSGLTPAKLVLAATTLAVIFVAQFALFRIFQRFTEDPLADARIAFARNTFAAARAFMPFGSGMGTFVPVYAMFEKPEDALVDTYANRAHNDLLELALEAGVFGLGLLGIFLIWLGVASVRLWRRPALESGQIDLLLARAATIVVSLIIVHSFVDYPLRTAAMMGILAFACALLVDPPHVENESEVDSKFNADNLPRSTRVTPARQPATTSSPTRAQPDVTTPPAHQKGERWGEGIQWPEEWTTDANRRSSEAIIKPRPPRHEPSD
jgi:O-antigen ligase